MDITAQRIVQLIDASSLSDSDIERELALPRSTVYDWRNERSKSYKKHILKIAEYFSVSSSYLMGETDDPGEKKEPTGGNASRLSDEDREFIEAFRAASPEKRQAILALLK